MKVKVTMSIDQEVLLKMDRFILETKVFKNRSEMVEFFTGFLELFDESFKNLSVEETILKIIEKKLGKDLNQLPKNKKEKLENKEKNINNEQEEIQNMLSNFKGGFFK